MAWAARHDWLIDNVKRLIDYVKRIATTMAERMTGKIVSAWSDSHYLDVELQLFLFCFCSFGSIRESIAAPCAARCTRTSAPMGGNGSKNPAKAKRRLLRYLKKGNYYLVATNWGGTKQKQITKNNRFEKQQISKISHFRKQHISKTTTNEKKANFKKRQISKKNRSQKTINFEK